MSDILTPAATNDIWADCWTRREILQQPDTLQETQSLLLQQKAALKRFLSPLLADENLRIILTGAGTSAFIGECLAPWLSRETGRRVEAVATTDIVSAPQLYCEADTPTLLVSFGRSGNSPESIAAVDIADKLIADIHHLVITCNEEGALSRDAGKNAHVIVLPERTHDRGFAMTSSFSSMMLAALSSLSDIGTMDARIGAIAESVRDIAVQCDIEMEALAKRNFSRVVYLGSGVFKGLAREAALKLLELTDGAIITAFDTPMGFRHGPKTVVNSQTLVVIFVSNDPYTSQYDRDLIDELRKDGLAGEIVTVSAQSNAGDTLPVSQLEQAKDADLLFPYIVPAQLFALHCSIAHGITPDTPNTTGAVNRVVQGVTLHPLAS